MSLLYPNHTQIRKVVNPMARTKSFVLIHGNKLADTGKAVKFQILRIRDLALETPRTEWFPISQLDKIFSDPERNQGKDYIIATSWIVGEKGLDKLEGKIAGGSEIPVNTDQAGDTGDGWNEETWNYGDEE
jgi:hypothetical protein